MIQEELECEGENNIVIDIISVKLIAFLSSFSRYTTKKIICSFRRLWLLNDKMDRVVINYTGRTNTLRLGVFCEPISMTTATVLFFSHVTST